jgi:hypothetical protein
MGNELINQVGLTGHYENINHHKEKIVLETTRALSAGETLDLRTSIKSNYDFYK